MRQPAARGYTILEMLIATTILSAVLSVGFYAYQMLSTTLAGNFKRFDRTFEEARLLITLQELLESVRPLVVPVTEDKAGIYFEGTNRGFITAVYPAEERPVLEILRLSAVEGESSEWPHELQLERARLPRRELERFDEQIPFSPPETLARCSEPPRFSYRGWASSDALFRALERPTGPAAELPWQDAYNGLASGLLPETVAVVLACGFPSQRLEVVMSDADLIAISIADMDR